MRKIVNMEGMEWRKNRSAVMRPGRQVERRLRGGGGVGILGDDMKNFRSPLNEIIEPNVLGPFVPPKRKVYNPFLSRFSCF